MYFNWEPILAYPCKKPSDKRIENLPLESISASVSFVFNQKQILKGPLISKLPLFPSRVIV